MPRPRDSRWALERHYHVQEKRPIIRPSAPSHPQTAWEDPEAEAEFLNHNLVVAVDPPHPDLVMQHTLHLETQVP